MECKIISKNDFITGHNLRSWQGNCMTIIFFCCHIFMVSWRYKWFMCHKKNFISLLLKGTYWAPQEVCSYYSQLATFRIQPSCIPMWIIIPTWMAKIQILARGKHFPQTNTLVLITQWQASSAKTVLSRNTHACKCLGLSSLYQQAIANQLPVHWSDGEPRLK